MNIKSVIDLSEQLKNLGFSDLLNYLVKRICFKPKRFTIDYKIEKSGNMLHCQLSFEKSSETASGYSFMYYDATFQPAQTYEGNLAGVNVTLLAKKMSEIDWIKAFSYTEKIGVEVENGAYENELKIAAVVDDLSAIESIVEGKPIVFNLKQKYWSGIAGYDSNILETIVKGKTEICQRFYIITGQPAISVDEAYRYLQNRWLEKELLAKKKQVESSPDENSEATGYGTGLLKKRRRRRTTSSKSGK